MKSFKLPIALTIFLIGSFMLSGQTAGMTIQLKVDPSREKELKGSAVFMLIESSHVHKRHFIADGFRVRLEEIKADTFQISVRDYTDGFGDTTVTLILGPDEDVEITIPYPVYCRYDAGKQNKTCPVCGKKDKVIPIIYGLLLIPEESNRTRKKNVFYYGGCEVTGCDPNWHCNRDDYNF